MVEKFHVDAQQVPMHRRIAEDLSNQVRSGKLKPGEKLPSERQIARRFQASRATVRTALQHLEQTGLISRRERRSAVVTIRRDITPYLRIACSTPKIINLFNRLSEMHILPARCQIQLYDMQQSDSVQRLAAQTTSAVDLLVCDLEYIHCFRNRDNSYTPIPLSLVQEADIHPALFELCRLEKQLVAVPLGFWPMLLFFNEARFRDTQIAMPEVDWSWDYFQNLSQRLTFGSYYGFQFRPVFEHLSAIMAGRGCPLYQEGGRVNILGSPAFEQTLRFISDLLHILKVSPILAKVEHINPFAQHRCAMALDGLDRFPIYQHSLGHDLHVGQLPNQDPDSLQTGGLVAVVMPGMENVAAVQDLLRNLVSINTQRMLFNTSCVLPVRRDLLHLDTFASQSFPESLVDLIERLVDKKRCMSLPGQTEHKYAVENLFLELWLGLDHIDSICQRFREL
jgi:DNA-binding transcriptional regulator YhcF (GntR family)